MAPDNVAAVREDAQAFAIEEIEPVASRVDRENAIPGYLKDRMAAEGYYGRLLPEEYGGQGATYPELCAQQEGLAYGSMAVASTVMASSLCSLPIVDHGTPDQQERFLTGLASGEQVGTIGITEPSYGSNAAGMQTRARRDGDEWVLDGEKWLIDNTKYADFFLVFARTDPDAEPKHAGISTFVVERDRAGFEVEEIYDLIGLRGLGVGGFSLDGVRVPAENLVGEQNKGFYQLQAMLSGGRTATAALVTGGAQAALDYAKAYATGREQFGQPLVEFQDIRFKLAEMATKVDATRELVYRAADVVEAGDRADREASMAKFFSATRGLEVANEAVQIHGGIGLTRKAHVERMLRDMRIFSVGEGTNEMQKTVIARRELESEPPVEAPVVEEMWDDPGARQ
jgi:alkylation response protein AidB-like acyl-CoA dehydrogenase